MYYNIYRQVVDLITTVKEMQSFFIDCPHEVVKYIGDCQYAVNMIKNVVEEEVVESIFILDELQSCYKDQRYVIENGKEVLKKIEKLENIVTSFPFRWRMVFLPYKASMWTSMESIWEEAKKDERCEVYVMPIPYVVFNGNGEVEKTECEIDLFPEYVETVAYNPERVVSMHPEFIIIHNPYDDLNNLTRVPEFCFSRNLRKHTSCLVYSPYFTFFTGDNIDRLICTPGNIYSDKIIVQSEAVAHLYRQKGYKKEKLLIVGSPKLDAIVHMDERKVKIPDLWKKKLAGRKIVLYTFSLQIPFQTERIHIVLNRMKEHWKDNDLGFIFRPHPLLRDFCKGRTPNASVVEEIFQFVEQDDRIVLDTNESYMPAFLFSDGFMMHDSTSLMNEYLMTGKPMYWDYVDGDRKEPEENAVMDFRALYCIYSEQLERILRGEEIEEEPEAEFFRAVKTGSDRKKEIRLEICKKAFHRIDGQAGKEAYQTLIKELEN